MDRNAFWHCVYNSRTSSNLLPGLSNVMLKIFFVQSLADSMQHIGESHAPTTNLFVLEYFWSSDEYTS